MSRSEHTNAKRRCICLLDAQETRRDADRCHITEATIGCHGMRHKKPYATKLRQNNVTIVCLYVVCLIDAVSAAP